MAHLVTRLVTHWECLGRSVYSIMLLFLSVSNNFTQPLKTRGLPGLTKWSAWSVLHCMRQMVVRLDTDLFPHPWPSCQEMHICSTVHSSVSISASSSSSSSTLIIKLHVSDLISWQTIKQTTNFISNNLLKQKLTTVVVNKLSCGQETVHLPSIAQILKDSLTDVEGEENTVHPSPGPRPLLCTPLPLHCQLLFIFFSCDSLS